MESKAIGVINSGFSELSEAPRQGRHRMQEGKIELFSEFSQGLLEIDGFSHIILVWEFHKSKGFKLTTLTPWSKKEKGVFSTRSPFRPNPIGITVVELLEREKNILKVRGLDCIDGTPLLDIKPFIKEIDCFSQAKNGWLERKMEEIK